MEKQPEALRLAEALEDFWGQYGGPEEPHELNAAAELRRLHDENEHLRMSQYGSGRLQMLRNQRDELLDALKKIAGLTMSQFMNPQDLARECITIANNATSKATGQ